ncbi:tubulin binding cofactor A [Cladophialophora yegresii CBS 114405]|uniref:Tubulin-specific chaperone A n=1 Tax=Cladophialophora yegresii CBS 114405 TaxID=1182544 RepID=W9VW99_9EURO|nr:tubulin binding cofactor A [Cladophialophora yegresii CBS 114405]EXJ56496.1 tubulin binding cofactor A [Cladophialophora yegresii CBS 114405]
MAPSQIQIAISSLQRLLNEEQSYYKEQAQQEARIAKLENPQANGNDENHEYQLNQERKALDETKAMIPQMRDRITNAREKLENMLVSHASLLASGFISTGVWDADD